jgi:hypothetical protein
MPLLLSQPTIHLIRSFTHVYTCVCVCLEIKHKQENIWNFRFSRRRIIRVVFLCVCDSVSASCVWTLRGNQVTGFQGRRSLKDASSRFFQCVSFCLSDCTVSQLIQTAISKISSITRGSILPQKSLQEYTFTLRAWFDQRQQYKNARYGVVLYNNFVVRF